jgi:hypothetical protein
MLCDVVSAVAEFMVRVLPWRSTGIIHNVVAIWVRNPAMRVIQ